MTASAEISQRNPSASATPSRGKHRVMAPVQVPLCLVLLAAIPAHAAHVTSTSTKTLSPFANKALTIVKNHRIVQSNAYTEWFAEGDASIDQAQDLVKQFSVFSNLFLLAQRTCSLGRQPTHARIATL